MQGPDPSPNIPSKVVVKSGGLLRLDTRNQESVLRQPVLRQSQPHGWKQWTQAPTPELVALLTAMRDEARIPLGDTSSRACRAEH